MQYTPEERSHKLWALVENDPECAEFKKEMDLYREKLESFSDKLPFKLGKYLWACPTSIHIYFHRVLELAMREMRFPEELPPKP